MANRPLTGKRVIDLTTALAGPYATLLLAGLGAEVVKVENPFTGGDSARTNAPYLGPDGLKLAREHPDDMSVSMLLRSRNKRSVTLNLKHAGARDIFADLIRDADVLVENFSAGVTRRLGIDYAFAREVNPRLVYTSISGFGAQGGGPGTGKAMDAIVQALAGVMLTAGSPDDPPVRFGLPIADLTAPLFAVIGTLAAVVHAERTGEGQHVDVSMLGALTSLMACEPFDLLEAAGLPLRTGTTVPRLAPFGVFPARDGWFALSAPTDTFARGVFAALGRDDLASDPRFATRDGRVANADQLHDIIRVWAAELDVADVLERLTAHGAPAAEVRDPIRAVRDPLGLARGDVLRLAEPGPGNPLGLIGPGVPVRFSAADPEVPGPAPRLGEHNADVYGTLLGYSEERLKELAEDGLI